MKTLLVSASIEPESRNAHTANAPYSIGLSYIHAVLAREGHDAELLFLNNHDYESSHRILFDRIAEASPDVVAFQIFSMNRTSTFSAIECLSSNYPAIKVIIGGIHTSVMYRQILMKFPHVIAVIGEGEITMTELLPLLDRHSDISAVAGIAFVQNGKIHVTPRRELLKNLDTLPFPLHETFFDNEPERIIAHIISSRGCPFDCSFCCLKVVSMRRYRERDIRSVVDEIEMLKKKYPRLRQIQFHDDTFTLNNARVIEFCKLVIERKLGLTFVCSARVKPVSAEMFSWMQKAGFVKVMFGLETGSPALLKSIHKEISREDVLNLFHLLKPFDLAVTTFLMCGFPGETQETINETIALVRETQKIHYNWIAGVAVLWVYPGTEVYEIMKKAGKITDDYWLTDQAVPYFTVEHDLEVLKKFEEQMANMLSVTRIFTPQGFRQHFMIMPMKILRFILKRNNRGALTEAVKNALSCYFPGTSMTIVNFYGRHLKRHFLRWFC